MQIERRNIDSLALGLLLIAVDSETGVAHLGSSDHVLVASVDNNRRN